MVNRIKSILCAICLVSGVGLSWAQEPITVTVTPVQRVLPPQIGLYLDNPGKYFTLTLKNNSDVTQNVFMGMQIEQIAPFSNMAVVTPPARMPRNPIIVAPGEIKMLNMVEMKTLFNHLNYTTDVSVRGNVDGGLLEEGTYEVRLTAYKWDVTLTTPYPLSMPTGGRCQFEVCYKAQAPRILYPVVINTKISDGKINKKGLDRKDKWFDFGNDFSLFSIATLPIDNPIFTWTPPTSNCSSMGSYNYSFKIAQLLPGQSPTEAMSNGAFYEKNDLKTPQCIVPASYVRRMKDDVVYVAQVTAHIGSSFNTRFPRTVNSMALDYMVLENEGKSEIRLFKMGKQGGDVTPDPDDDDDGDDDDGDDDSGGSLDGEGSSSGTGFKGAQKDSLYVFTNPTITSPKFPEITYRKVFTGEDIHVEWRKAWFAKGEGERQDTIKHKYTVQLFLSEAGESRSQTFKKKPLFSEQTEELKDTIKWDDMEGKMKVGDFYILRVLAESMNEKSVRYENDSVNTTDFYLANRYTKTREFSCPESDAPSNTTPTTSTAEQLKGKKVGLGAYTLTLGNDLKKSDEGTFSGTGHVEWNPVGMKLMVAVKFDDIRINTENVVYEGVVKSDPGEQIERTDMECVEQLFSEWGVDNFIADLNMPLADQVQGLANDKVGNLAKNLNISKYYEYYIQGKKALSLMRGGTEDVHLPISIDDIYNDTPVDIQIANMTFTPTRAMMNIIGEFKMPDSDITQEEFLIFGAPMLCMSPDRLLPESGNMCLLSHFTLKDPKTKFKCKFIAPDDITNPVDGCYVAWKDDAFEFLQVHVEMAIPDLKKDVGGEAVDVEPVLTLKASINDWENWMALAAMEPFQVEDLPGYTFSPGYILYDHHSEENNELMPLPDGYNKGLASITKDAEWQGLYMRNMYLSIPTIIEGSGKVDDSAKEQVEEIVQQGGQTTVVKEDKKKVDIADSRVKFLLKNFYLDKSGVSCKAAIDTREYLKAATNKVGGWDISLDEIYVDVLQNNFKSCGFNGKFSVPLLKNKKGKKAEIHYKAGLESYNKRENPKAEDRLFIFKTWQEEDISMDFFLADVKFDPKQTYFLAEAEDTKSARVELCLGGEVTVSSRIANKAPSLNFLLPKMPFTRMRLANCPRWKSEVDKSQAQQYEDWKNEWAAEGRDDDRTMVSDDKSVYFDIGKWGGASPQKKLGGFSFTIDKFKLNTNKLADKQIGLTVAGTLGLFEGKVNVAATFSIMANADLKNKTLSYKETNFEDATIDVNGSDFAGLELKGKLKAPKTDQEKGYKGELKFTLPGGLLEFEAAGAYVEKEKTQTEIDYELKKRYGSSIPANAKIDSTYNYCFLEILASSKALSKLQPVSVKSIKGGFYYNCRKKDTKIDFSTDNITAQYGMMGGMFGVGLTCGGENAITANGDMTVFYDLFHNRLSTIKMKADIHAVTNDEGTKGLVNAEASIVYECTNEKKYFEVDITVDAAADMDDAFKEFVGSDLVNELKKKSETGLSEMGEGKGRNTETSESDKKKQQEKGESSGHLKAGAKVNVNFKMTWKENKVEYKTALWHLYIGQPSKNEEQDKRCRITFIDFALGKKTDRFAMWATIYADAYLCFGNELPLDDLPPIPKEISEYLGLKQAELNQGDGDLNSEAVNTRVKQFSTFKPGGDKGGVAFGAKIYGDMGLNLGLIYANATAIAGFDVMIMKLKKGTQCIGGGEAGKHGWYGMGQVYALLKGEIGLDIDMWLFRGKIPLVGVGVGALLKAGMPNPTWVYGKAKAHFKLLGGLIKGSATVQLKAGEVCTPEFGNPLDDIEIFGDVSPGDEDRSTGWNEENVISASVYPEFNTNMEMDAIFRLLDQNKAYQMAGDGEELEKYTEQASRTYRFRLSEDQCRLALFEPSQATAEKPSPTWDRPVPCKTKNHTIYHVASGTLDYGKLYRLQLSGYAQEFRNGEWGDPFFNDSTTNHKEQRKPWSQTKTYYFRTDPTPAPLKDDIMIFHTDYTDDLKRPTFALAHARWDIDNFGSVDEPVSLRIEVAKDNGIWESPTKILHNETASQQYNAEKAAYDKAVQEAYDAAMKEYEEGPLAEYYKKKNEAYNQWKNTAYLPWLNENYPGWKDWKFVIKKKYYNEEQSIAKDVILDNGIRGDIQHELEKDILGHLADVAREKGEVGKMKDVLEGLTGGTGSRGGGRGVLGGGTGILGGGTGIKDPVINTGNNTTVVVGSRVTPTGTNIGSRVTPTNTNVGTRVTTPNVTNTRATENVRQTGAGRGDIRRFHGPMPDLDIVETNDTIRKVGRVVTTGKVTTGNSDITKKIDNGKDETTYVKLGRKKGDNDDKDENIGLAGSFTAISSNTPMYIDNVFNPAEGDRNTYKPYITTIVVKSDGSEYKDELKSSQSFFLVGTPYVELTYINTTYVSNYVCINGKIYSRDGMVSEHEGITQQQWNFLTDKNCPVFTYDVPVPPTPSLADVIASVNLPEVSEPDLQRDMDSESFEIPLEEFKVDTDVKGDYIFLRTKKDINIAPITTLKGRGYKKLRISINRVHKKSYDNLLDRIDELALTYSTQKAEKLEGQQMGGKQTKGYDSKQAGKSEVSQDGELNMDAYLTDYIKEMESETVGLDSMAVQRLKHNVDMKDFSTCLYYKDIPIDGTIYDNFEAEYKVKNSEKYWEHRFIRTQLQKVEYEMSTNYNNAEMATNKFWKQNPYVSFGYWLKWAMIGGSTLYPRRDAACRQDIRPEFPGLELTLDKPEYRRANQPTYPDGGHLASSAYGKEISDVSQFFAPSMYDANDRSDHHRYTGGFKTKPGAIDSITAMIYADCRMAAAISNAPRKIVNAYFRGDQDEVTPEKVYDRIESIYGTQKIYLEDNYKDIININNKAIFSVRHVPIMIYADYADRVDNTNAKEKFWDEQISLGTVWSGNTCRILQDPAIAWRLDRTIGHQVTSDNELIGIKSQRNGNIEAKSLLNNIRSLKFATYRQNAYHTGFSSGSSVSNYDVCTEQRANGSWYVKKPEIIEFDYNSFDESKLGDYEFEIKDIMK